MRVGTNVGRAPLGNRIASTPALVAVEAAGIVAMHMLEQDGILTIGAVAMPGSAPAIRLMMYPDGARLGIPRIVAALEGAIARLSELLDDLPAARELLLGDRS